MRRRGFCLSFVMFSWRRKHLPRHGRLVRVLRFDTYFKKWSIEYRKLIKQDRNDLRLSSQVHFHTLLNSPHMVEDMLEDEKTFYDADG